MAEQDEYIDCGMVKLVDLAFTATALAIYGQEKPVATIYAQKTRKSGVYLTCSEEQGKNIWPNGEPHYHLKTKPVNLESSDSVIDLNGRYRLAIVDETELERTVTRLVNENSLEIIVSVGVSGKNAIFFRKE